MAVVDLYSHRKLAADGVAQDVHIYDKIPSTLRVQIAYIWNEAIGNAGWDTILRTIAREYGTFDLGDGQDAREKCVNILMNRRKVDAVLDLVEVSFRYAEANRPATPPRHGTVDFLSALTGVTVTPEQAVAELNERFRRAGVGYRYENGMMFRIDSDLVHSEVVKPALRFRQRPCFEGPRQEFLNAHAHYRAGENKDATDANNAFESTLKAICDKRRWEYPGGATASQLVKVVKNNGLLPDYLGKSFDQLVATLQSGLPKVRGQEGAHGQGAKPRPTPDHVASYALHLAAAKILFLVEADAASKFD